MKVTYKAGVIIKHIRMLAKEYPKGTYKPTGPEAGCSYSKGSVSNGPKTKGCVVGQAIRAAYPELWGEIKKRNDYSSIETVLREYGIQYTDNQIRWLSNFQNNQDSGTSWCECHKEDE